MSVLSNVMRAPDKAKLCQILIKEFPFIFENIDTLPIADDRELSQATPSLGIL